MHGGFSWGHEKDTRHRAGPAKAAARGGRSSPHSDVSRGAGLFGNGRQTLRSSERPQLRFADLRAGARGNARDPPRRPGRVAHRTRQGTGAVSCEPRSAPTGGRTAGSAPGRARGQAGFRSPGPPLPAMLHRQLALRGAARKGSAGDSRTPKAFCRPRLFRPFTPPPFLVGRREQVVGLVRLRSTSAGAF